ncbi:MAG: hemerythrin domain-containing protein [Burkholderiales bacterium]|nr:hemerythrin domain-containing protein [Burkholderiales bacterium]
MATPAAAAVPADAPATPLTWTDNFVLGFAPMDDTHREFVACLAAVQTADDAALPDALDALAAHLAAHFAQEDQWMRETEFPPRDCHIDEHAAVLESMRAVREKVAEGDLANGRRLAQALADWFPGHADYLDSALSHWMFKRRFGGKPVVIRREAAGLGR